MKEVLHSEWNENIFKTIGKDWLLITAEKDGKQNTMTASWGGVGYLWNRNVAYIFIRPQRYTKEFVDSADKLSLSVLPGKYRKELAYLGKASGRDEDKISNTNLTVKKYEDVPYFEEARLTFICKKLYAQDLGEQHFIEKGIVDQWYQEKDFHTMYVVEIEKILEK